MNSKLRRALPLALAGCFLAAAQDNDLARSLNISVPYVPTPPAVVEAMLKATKVKRTDVVYDLGSGDGRIVVMAAEKFGARGVGYDINPERIAEANDNAKKAGVTARVKFIQKDIMEADLREATVITLYLLPSVNLELRPKLFRECKPGTRIVSHAFDMGDWKAEKELTVNGSRVYYWAIPADKSALPPARPAAQ